MVDFYGKLVGIHTNPMDGMGVATKKNSRKLLAGTSNWHPLEKERHLQKPPMFGFQPLVFRRVSSGVYPQQMA